MIGTQGTYACHLHISVGHLIDSTTGTHDHNYLQQKETRMSMIIYVQNLCVSGTAGDVIYITLVPSIYNTCKDQMFYYNWAILGDMFRPLNGHLQANVE